MAGNRAVQRAWKTGDVRAVNAQPNAPKEDIPLITDTTELITPAIAQEMLQRNQKNRPVNWNRVDEQAKTMKAGNWKLTPQGIILDRNGNILTGQHRLLAVVRSGVACYFRVSRGNNPEIARLLDRGAPQSARDLAARETERKHSPTESSIVRAIAVLQGVPRPTVDECAVIMTKYAPVMEAMLEQTKGTKKTKALLMVLAVIAFEVVEPEAAAIISLDSGRFAAELEKRLAPQTADQCWGKGTAFALALKVAREVVNG